jgi:hypothetical protein
MPSGSRAVYKSCAVGQEYSLTDVLVDAGRAPPVAAPCDPAMPSRGASSFRISSECQNLKIKIGKSGDGGGLLPPYINTPPPLPPTKSPSPATSLPQLRMDWMDRRTSGPRALRWILMRSSRLEMAPCAQHDPQYLPRQGGNSAIFISKGWALNPPIKAYRGGYGHRPLDSHWDVLPLKEEEPGSHRGEEEGVNVISLTDDAAVGCYLVAIGPEVRRAVDVTPVEGRRHVLHGEHGL